MTTAWRAAIIAVLTVALGVGIPAAAQAIDVTVGVRIAGSLVAAVLLLVLVRQIASDRADFGSRFEQAARPPAPRSMGRPAELEELERVVRLQAAGTRFFALRPRMREVAVHRLALRGVDLDRGEAASRLLGPELFAFVRDRGANETSRHADAVEPAQLLQFVYRLEAL